MILTLNDSEEAEGSTKTNPLKPTQPQNKSVSPTQKKPKQQRIFLQSKHKNPHHKLVFFNILLLFSVFSKKRIELNAKTHFWILIGYLSISIVKYSILIGLKTCIWILFFLHFLTLECANISYCWWKHPFKPMKLQIPNHGKYVFFLIKTIINGTTASSLALHILNICYTFSFLARALSFLILIER